MTRMGASSKSAREPGRFRRRYGVRSNIATAAAASQAAECRSARVITSATGPRADPRRSRTSRCCVGATTAPFTRRDIRSSDSPTASYASRRRGEDFCRTSQLQRWFTTIPSRFSEHRTRRRDCNSTPRRRAQAGCGSPSTWSGRSTSCIRERVSPRAKCFSPCATEGRFPLPRRSRARHRRPA